MQWLDLGIVLILFSTCGGFAAAGGSAAHYPFDRGAGDQARDASASERHAAIKGAHWRTTERGPALAFDGRSAFVDCGPSDRLGLKDALTLCAWIKPRKLPPRLQEPVVLGGYSRSWALTYSWRGHAYFYVAEPGNNLAVPLKPGRWRHVTATFDGRLMRLYVDAELKRERVLDEAAEIPSAGQFRIGGNPSQKMYFNGWLDDVRIYARSLSGAEVKDLVGGEVARLAPLRRRSATAFFENHTNPIDWRQVGERVLFANRHVGMEFRQTSRGFQLERFYGRGARKDFLAKGPANQRANLFQVMMTEPRGGFRAAFGVGNMAARSTALRVERDRKESTLRLIWKDVDLRDDKAALDVEVSVKLQAGDPKSYWRFRVSNRSRKWGISRVYFPIVNIAPIGDAKENVFIYPLVRGRLVRNPFGRERGYGDGVHESGRYPSAYGMQFQALYNERTEVGLYLATEDGTPNLRNIETPNYPTHLTWKPGHFPPNVGYAGEDFAVGYDCVVRPFRGDWWDACRLYREWALKQSWCRKGPLSRRRDIPRWYKEAPVFLCTANYSRDQQVAMIRDECKRFLKWAGVPLPLKWYGWKVYRTQLTAYDLPDCPWRFGGPKNPDRPCGNVHDGNYPALPALPGFARACSELRKLGGMVNPYVCLQIYDQGPTENAPYAGAARPHVVRDERGALQTYGREPSWAMCPWSTWWQSRLAETCRALLAREGVGGFYLDTMHGAGERCFATQHGHSACGGETLPGGMHHLVAHLHKCIKAADPDAIVTGEDSTENMIDVIDGKLYQHTLTPNDRAPLFATVYQDYIPRYGMSLIPTSDSRPFMQAAELFVEGAQIGRIYIGPMPKHKLSFDEAGHGPLLDFIGRMVAYYRSETARKFLCYGRLMRPIRFRSPDPMPEVYHMTSGKRISLPALRSGVFLSEDGDLGVFIVNTSEHELAFASDIVPARHGLPVKTMVRAEKVMPDGTIRPSGEPSSRGVAIAGTVRARDVAFFRIRPRWGSGDK